ncbi:MAG: tRNA (adenosine(37)-N6)-threonylcarbamoyltransferase complex ATPase subunit type 1 TsaE, partial [Burkholderiales bacterium]|nr:tRNA (adenosine(37)-N6)-threonylcarbamoyltransferase complex ATPase subunit type 1 TsaE [Burkholderiales bacterium]
MLSLTGPGLAVTLGDERATRRLAIDLASVLKPGDTVTLSGDLGAGKSTLARALIRHVAGDERLEVPSPSFTLVQSYALRIPIVHADLFRVSDPGELAELGLDRADERAIVLIEWPERAEDLMPADRIDIALRLLPQQGQNQRAVEITGHG